MTSVRRFDEEVARADLPPLLAVVCNAGISAGGVPGVTHTVDGVEPIFAVNHLGHFLLTNLLLHRMGPGGRIVFVTSGHPVGADRATRGDRARRRVPQYRLPPPDVRPADRDLPRRLRPAAGGPAPVLTTPCPETALVEPSPSCNTTAGEERGALGAVEVQTTQTQRTPSTGMALSGTSVQSRAEAVDRVERSTESCLASRQMTTPPTICAIRTA